jgi:hypothetical protein
LPQYWRVAIIGDAAVLADDNWNIRDVYRFDEFSEHDREVIHQWNQDHPDFLRGVLGSFGVRLETSDLDRRLEPGMVVDPALRDRARPAPEDLVSRLTPTPEGWRYMVIGDRLVLVDREWRIRRSYHFEH